MKGGVGKTTITVGIAYELARSFGKNVLIIDIDPQTNATLLVMKEKKYRKVDIAHKTIADLLTASKRGLMGEQEKTQIVDIIVSNPWNISKGKMDLIPSSIRLFEAKRILASMPYSEKFLEKTLKSIPNLPYDFCIIDSPPDFDELVIAALGASDYYIIPVRPDYMSQQGLIVLKNKLSEIKDHINCQLLGYVLNLIPTTRSIFHKKIAQELETLYEDKILARIKELQVYSIWPSTHKPLSPKDSRSPFVEIAKRLIEVDNT